MKKFGKIKSLGHRDNKEIVNKEPVYVLEKMDGSNLRFQLHDETGELMFGTRNTELKHRDTPLGPDDENVPKMFRNVMRHVKENIDLEALKALENETGQKLTLFGENMVKHTLDYDWDNTPQFLGFDVYASEDGYISSYSQVQKIFRDLGLETVPVVDVIKGDEIKEKVEVPKSRYRDGHAEGVVLRSSEGEVIKAKKVSEEFREKHGTNKSKNNDSGTDMDTRTVVDTYCTEARIRKQVNKMVVDEDRDLEMQLMKDLPIRVAEDIVSEAYGDLVRSNYTWDMKDFRSMIADDCVSVIREMMQEQM